MRIDSPAGAHLTYCTNIHPGETWTEVARNLDTHVPAVKQLVAPDGPFGVGLRLGHAAVCALAEPQTLDELREILARHDLYVFTLNGFPYGPFHGTAIKEAVYRPDWSEPARSAYTRALFDVLAAILPSDLEGSVSTVPGCFRARLGGSVSDDGHDAAMVEVMARRMLECVIDLWRRREAGGPMMTLALEPEPACAIETVAEAVAFFREHLWSGPAFEHFVEATGLARADAELVVQRHLGLCLDTCHAAVEFEDPVGAVEQLTGAGIRIAKVQVTTGLQLCPVTPGRVEALTDFADRVYLHQTVARSIDGSLVRFVDLPDAIAAHARGEIESEMWRVHFHVPVFSKTLDRFENTQAFLEPCLETIVRHDATRHFEVETYTWHVLPERYRGLPITQAIARELQWTHERLSA